MTVQRLVAASQMAYELSMPVLHWAADEQRCDCRVISVVPQEAQDTDGDGDRGARETAVAEGQEVDGCPRGQHRPAADLVRTADPVRLAFGADRLVAGIASGDALARVACALAVDEGLAAVVV